MKYNIFTIFDSSYIKFAKIFINSLYKTQDLSKIDTVYIYDAGINNEHKEWLNTYNKIKIIDDTYEDLEIDEKTTKWTGIILQKTYILKQLLEKEKCYPLVMIDIDCMFLKDISNLINLDYDFQFCKRNYNPKPLIASFVSFNNEKVLPFIDLWIEKISELEGEIRETPALCEIYKTEKNKYKIGLIDYKLVSATDDSFIDENTRILHFKGSNTKKNGVEIRLKRLDKIKKIKDIKKISQKYLEITKCIK